MVTVDDLTSAIGKPMDDAAVRALLEKLGPGTRSKDDIGIFYRHKTAGTILVENQGRLATVFLKPKGKGFKAYEGEIPFGIRFGQTKEDVRAALGEPTQEIGTFTDEYDQGMWTFKVNYTEAGVVERITLKAA